MKIPPSPVIKSIATYRPISSSFQSTNMKLSTYLNFNGNCEEALKFYETALGAKPVMMMRYGESPVTKETAKEMHQKILHPE